MIIETLEDQLRQAMLTSDVAVLEELIADDLVFTMHTGVMLTKQDDLEVHRNGIVRFSKVEVCDRQIHQHDHCAIVTLQADLAGITHEQPFSGSFRFTRVWVERGDRWQIVAGHVCQIPTVEGDKS
ncbi:MAG: nuclear transport factor 2 family protein [Oculatellaceae cyanobacterium Prado106]|jgi:ketosteroid isomerase-like protein|nr:nuclear transport factor 2 family protein [Oculatellaceae cyanobacterium Prado106]